MQSRVGTLVSCEAATSLTGTTGSRRRIRLSSLTTPPPAPHTPQTNSTKPHQLHRLHNFYLQYSTIQAASLIPLQLIFKPHPLTIIWGLSPVIQQAPMTQNPYNKPGISGGCPQLMVSSNCEPSKVYQEPQGTSINSHRLLSSHHQP